MELQDQKPKKKKVKVTKVVNGIEMEVEEEVDDVEGPKWGPRASHTVLNRDIERVDAPEKVTGRAKYTYDVRLPGMLFGYMLTSPHAHAEIVKLDTSAAEKLPGVKAILKFPDKKELKYEGDPVVAIAAVTPEIAQDAARAVQVEYKKLPHAVTAQQALEPNSPEVFQGGGKGNLRAGAKNGDEEEVKALLRTCEATVSAEYQITMQHHCCLETHGVLVDYRGGDKATVYASTQGTFTIPGEAAQSLGLKSANDVTCIVEYMGGGFGSKFGMQLWGDVAAKLSKMTQAPVKLMLTRQQEFLMAGNRSGNWSKVRAGAMKDGRLIAVWAEQYRLGGLSQGAFVPFPYIYRPEKSYRVLNALHTHQDGSVAMRAPGHPQASFLMESLMDDLAYKIGVDPIEFRKRNTPDPAYHRQLDLGAQVIGWKNRPEKPGEGPLYGPYKSLRRGMGCGLATWGGGGGPGTKVDVFIKPDGHVAVQFGVQDLGTGSRTISAGIVAEELGLPVKAIETRIGRSTYGAAAASGGSVTTGSISPAVKVAAHNARLMLFAKVAPALGVAPDQLFARDGKIMVKDKPEKALTWKQACATLGMDGVSARGDWQADLQASGVHGAYFAEVEVDIETGKIRVVKMVGVQDCGLPLNRLALHSQINGGMIQALGYALTEKHVVDANLGNMLNASLDDYKLPGCFEMPEMIPIIDDGDTREMPIGMAEPAVIPGASAIANAIHSACGVRVNSLPITPDKILIGLEKLRGRRA